MKLLKRLATLLAASLVVTSWSILVGGAPSLATASQVWSGWVATGGSYIAVQADFIQPDIGVTGGCSNHDAEVSHWVGLGGYTPGPDGYGRLIQVGTLAYHEAGQTRYSAWYQFGKYTSTGVRVGGISVTPLDVTIHAGDSIHLYTVIQTSTAKTTFYVYNNTTGQYDNPVKDLDDNNWGGVAAFYDGRTAEFVSEKYPGVGLAKFTALNWTNTKAYKNTKVWVTLGSQPKAKSWIVQGATTLATPDALSSNTSFTDRWKACGV